MYLLTRFMWRGESNRLYRFRIFDHKQEIPDAGGLYVFVRRRFFFFLKPLYVGKASNLQGRISGHERWEEAYKLGARERHIRCIRSEGKRSRIEEDLIRHLKPKLNTVHMPRDSEDAPNDPKLRKGWMSAKEYWALNDRPSKTSNEADETGGKGGWLRTRQAA